MIRALFWGLGALGVVVSGLAFAILTIGLLEGWRPMPDRLSQLVAIVLAAVASWLAGVICAHARGRWVALSVAVVPATLLALGFALMEKSEAHGAGLAPQLVAEAVAASTLLVGGAAFLARRTGSRPEPASTPL